MPSCTICGVAFGTRPQVRAHIQGSTGEHAGIGYADANEYISDAPVDEDEQGGAPADSPSAPADDGLSSDGLGVPQKDVAQGGASQSNDPTCPECGGNRWFSASEHTDYEYGCADCSTDTNWTVWNQ